MIDLGLQGARAVVAGAGFIPERAGHGRGTALQLAAAGATVACLDIDAGRASDIVAEIQQAGGKAVPIVADVVDPDDAQRGIAAAAAELGGIDVCVDIVGESKFVPTLEHSNEDWYWSIEKNLSQVFFVYRAAVAQMVRQGTGGSLVALASVDGIGPSTFHVAYGAAKAGLISLTKSFSDEFGRYGIRANAVAPGNVGWGNWDAPDVPFGGDVANSLAPPRPMDVANAVLFLSSALAARITGQVLVVDGGALTRAPWGLKEDQVVEMQRRSAPDA
jgi:NAD(P)-dependent dehydrogenase (short-subunit alcohol dehydrogenase family)